MENYYKDRKKQQTLFSKKLKKMAETGDKDLSRVKKEYLKWSIRPPNFERGEYWTEQEVIQEITQKIRDAEEEFITLKLDFCYDLSSDLDTYDALEKTILKLNKTRDRIMIEMHNIYPQYDFIKHKGYPTKHHFLMLDKYGPCSIHRKSTKPVQRILYNKKEL
jgi:hypothetical protein